MMNHLWRELLQVLPFIHNAAALNASDGGPITATQIPRFIPQTIKQFV